MRRGIIIAGIAAVTLAVLVVLLVSSRHRTKDQSATAPTDNGTRSRTAGAGTATSMLSPKASAGRDNAGEIARAIERVTGAGRVQVTTSPGESGRRVCILIDEPERFYELDQGLTPGDFPVLQKAGFQAAPAPIIRTMSIYRSLAKTAMGYNASDGDRIVVLLCPKDAWQEVQSPWPAASRAASR